MNPLWIRALVLVCTFGAVVLAAEALLRAYASARAEGQAINLRLTLIGRGKTHGEAMNILRRATSSIPKNLPPALHQLALKFERMLLQAQLTIPTSRLMLFILLAPFAIFLAIILMMAGWWGIGISFGRIVICAVFAFALGAVIPIMVLNFKATRVRKRMEE